MSDRVVVMRYGCPCLIERTDAEEGEIIYENWGRDTCKETGIIAWGEPRTNLIPLRIVVNGKCPERCKRSGWGFIWGNYKRKDGKKPFWYKRVRKGKQ